MKYEIETPSYKIQSESLKYKYSVKISFNDKSFMLDLIKVVKRAFEHYEKTKADRKRVKELMAKEKEERRSANQRGPL